MSKRKKKVATYNFTLEQIENMVKEGVETERDAMQHEIVSAVTAVFLVCLHDEYGFGRKRMQRLLARFQNTFDCINEDELLELDDFYRTCKEEFGIEIKEGY